MTRPLQILSALLLAAACDSKPDLSPDPPAAGRIKLVELGGAQWTPASVALSDFQEVWSEDFANGTEAWHRISTPSAPATLTDGVLEVQTSSESGTPYLRLQGTRGLVVQVIPIEPGAAYEFTGSLRAGALVPAATPFHGATFWLAELGTEVSFERIVGDIEQAIHVRHILPTAAGAPGWTKREKTFRTGPDTRALLIGCALGTSEDVSSGAVDFRQLQLVRVPDHAYWDALARSAAAARSGFKHPDWRARRRISADLRAELRPSIVLLPGETMSFRQRLQETDPLLDTGFGIWRKAHLSGRTILLELAVSIDGQEVWTNRQRVPNDTLKARWHDVEIDLSAWAGKTVNLELACRGSTPAVFGAPCLRSRKQGEERPNVLLISIDMLRSDHVGAYGYERGTTPELDRLAAENLLFPEMHAQAAYTLPATVSIFSGQFASVHGVFRGTQAVSAARSPLLAELLSSAGYRTQGFTSGGFVSADFGLDAGFDGFTNVDPLRHRDSNYFHLLRDRNPELTGALFAEHGPERITNWLTEHADEPFFLFLHTYTVHDYDAPDGWLRCAEYGCTTTRSDYTSFLPHIESSEVATAAEREHLLHRYDGSLRYVDHLLGEILAHLEHLELDQRTIVAITSDHGEEMFERGVIQHGKTLYEELTRIPLILRVPGVEARVVGNPAMSIDIAPTLLAALGIPRDERMQGTNLLADDFETRPVLAEINDNFAHKYAIRDGLGFKLIHSMPGADVKFPGKQEWELYDTRKDPGETIDLSRSETPADKRRFEQLKSALLERIALFERLGQSLGGVESAEVDEETRQQLQQLGY